MQPLISVIIPTYNRQWAVGRAIASVLAQTFQDFELLIVDDGSEDETFSQVLQPLKDPRVKIHRTENRGVSAARNFAVEKSQGQWLAFLDSDDEWKPEKLAEQWQAIKENPHWRWVHTEEIWIRNGQRVNPMTKHAKRGGDIFVDALKLCCVSPSAVMIEKSLLQEAGSFREDFPVCEDYDLWLKLASLHEVGFVDKPLVVKKGGHEDQLSRRFFAMDYWRIMAMGDLLDQPLTPEKIQQTCRELILKAAVLLKGYRKHSNLQEYDSVYRQMKKAESLLCLHPL